MAGAIHSTKMEKQKPPPLEKNKENPSKFYYHFLYKAFIVAIFLVILPFFPSQAPQFINQSLLTRNWELLHLLFVGIAISYGLFSRRNDETEKDKEKENNSSKFDNANLVVSRFLQLSSFFEDENETSSSESDETQFQTWKIQYYRNKPEIVVPSHHSNFEEQSATSSRIGEKPLLLPVRSLKSRVSSDPNVSSPTTKSGSKRSSSNSNKARDGELEGSGSSKVEDEVKENLVLPSPIPWRSSLSMDHRESRSMKSQKPRSSQHSSISHSPSFSSESLAKNAEDLMRKKSFYKSCPPPPPPPPPTFQKSISMKPSSNNSFNKGASFDKELKRSFTSERNELKGWSIGNNLMGRVDSEIEVKPKGKVENLSMGKSIRKVRAEGMNGRKEKSQLDSEEEHYVEEPTRKALGYDHMSLEEEKESFIDKLIVESDEDTESEDEEEVGGTLIQKESGESSITNKPSSSNVNGDEGPDVDKKADEFIAKFREQIRLQRIESIKRSARIATRNSSR